MSSTRIDGNAAGQSARRLAEAAEHERANCKSGQQPKSVDPKNERALAEQAMESWIHETSCRPSNGVTRDPLAPAPRPMPVAPGQVPNPGHSMDPQQPKPLKEQLASAALWHLAAMVAPAPVALTYLATHASGHDGEGAGAVIHAATMIHRP